MLCENEFFTTACLNCGWALNFLYCTQLTFMKIKQISHTPGNYEYTEKCSGYLLIIAVNIAWWNVSFTKITVKVNVNFVIVGIQ